MSSQLVVSAVESDTAGQGEGLWRACFTPPVKGVRADFSLLGGTCQRAQPGGAGRCPPVAPALRCQLGLEILC